MFVCQIGNFCDLLVGADDRREKKIDRRGFRRLVENRHRLGEVWNICRSLYFIGAAGDRQAYELQTPGRHTGSRSGPCLAFKIGGQVAMAAEVTFGIDHARKKMFAAQVDDPLCIRQKRIATDGGDLAVDDGEAAFDDAGRRDDQTVLKNDIRGVFSHKITSRKIPFPNR